jgi:hypothetical protein
MLFFDAENTYTQVHSTPKHHVRNLLLTDRWTLYIVIDIKYIRLQHKIQERVAVI